MRKLNCNFFKKVPVGLLLILIYSFTVNLLADGLPGEYYVTQRWRDLFAGHSPATNPAFMTEENYFTTRMALSPTLQNNFFLMELGAIIPTGLYQSAGISYLGLSSRGDVPRSYYNEGDGTIVVTDDLFSGNQNLFILSYAVNPWGRLSFGTNVNLFHKANFDSSITSLCLDVALSYRLPRHPFLGDHVVGVNFQNLLSPDFAFQSWHSEAANLKVSWLGKLWESRIEVGIDLDIKDLISQAEDFAQNEVSRDNTKQVEFDFNSRIGFWILRMINIYFQAGSDYWGICPGLNVPSVNTGRDFQVAYQFMSVIDNVDLSSTHTFYFRGDFGKHREEIYARKMARMASLGPTVLYNQARTLYAQGKYWDAFFIFGKILTESVDFFKNDWVQLHMGLCQEQLDMKEFATENYLKTKKSFKRSEVVCHADLGLLRLYYRDGNSFGVANQFARLNTAATPDSLKYHAFYYMGLQHLKDRKSQKAIQLFELIPQSHPEYAFARFSSAIANASSNNMNDAVMALHDATQSTPTTMAQREIINKALTLLGYIFFEGIGGVEQSFSQAVSALRKVPVTSYFYEDAQIGLAWVALKASNWVDCIKACDEILRTSKKIVLQCEAMLLKSYCAMINKKYKEAVSILTPAYEKINATTPPAESEREAEEEKFYDHRDVYYKIATSMNELSLAGESSLINKQIDSLHAPQEEYEKKIRSYYTFNDEFARFSFFNKNSETLRNDIEYALAKAEKMSGMGKMLDIQEKVGEEIEKIDDKIEQYEEELEKFKEEE